MLKYFFFMFVLNRHTNLTKDENDKDNKIGQETFSLRILMVLDNAYILFVFVFSIFLNIFSIYLKTSDVPVD